jgi:hypothetical protein
MSNKSLVRHTINQIISPPAAAPVAKPPVNPPQEKPTFVDRKLVCPGCGSEWIWKAEEQRFYADKGINIPKWCVSCRNSRRKYFMAHPTMDRNKK